MVVVPAAWLVGGHVGLRCWSSFPLLRQCLSQKPSVLITKGESRSSLPASAAPTTLFTPPSLSSWFVQETLGDLGQENDLQSKPAAVSSSFLFRHGMGG